MKSKLYICMLQFERSATPSECCRGCSHAYPHKHTNKCNGYHCLSSNPMNDSEYMIDLLTCKPLADGKEGFSKPLKWMA